MSVVADHVEDVLGDGFEVLTQISRLFLASESLKSVHRFFLLDQYIIELTMILVRWSKPAQISAAERVIDPSRLQFLCSFNLDRRHLR